MTRGIAQSLTQECWDIGGEDKMALLIIAVAVILWAILAPTDSRAVEFEFDSYDDERYLED